MYDILIKGNGFKAIYLALFLRKKFKSKSIAIKFSGTFGGIFNSIELENHFLDIGCHLFDYTDMIMEYNKQKPQCKLEVLIVDEAQDLSFIQWEMINNMKDQVERR